MAVKSSGAISFLDIRNEFGGAAPNHLSQYYRGGARVPSTRNTYVREPATGYSTVGHWAYNKRTGEMSVIWADALVATTSGSGTTEVTAGGWTYHRGALGQDSKSVSIYTTYRTKGSTVDINTKVPSSGAISFSQFYGATKT